MISRKRAAAKKRVREAAPAYNAATRRLLLDTHVWLWWRADHPRLGQRARAAIQQADDVYLSVASAWEIAIKVGLRKLIVPSLQSIPADLARHDFKPLAVSLEHALAVAGLPPVHRDPFDRMLAIQALTERLTVVTDDPVFDAYRVPVLNART